MAEIDVKQADIALARLCEMRLVVSREAFYRQADRLLDIRNRAALVARLEAQVRG